MSPSARSAASPPAEDVPASGTSSAVGFRTPEPSASRVLRILRRGFRALFACGALGISLFAIVWFAIPLKKERMEHLPQARRILDASGRILRMEVGSAGSMSIPIPLGQANPWLTKAIIAAEDQRFESHPGVDLIAIVRAMGQNASAQRVVSGASTLSTQIMRMTHPQPRTWLTKAIEALHAMQMETMLSKNEILEQYLNRAPFGGNLIGVEAASRAWFGKSAGDLSLAEAALLMGLPQSPSRLRPDRNPTGAMRRREYVLERMVQEGMITEEQCAAAARAPTPSERQPPPFLAPHFCDLLLQTRSDAVVKSTLDMRVQTMAERILRDHSARLSLRGIYGGAVVIADVENSSVLAMVGSPDYCDTQHSGQINSATARRAPGSTLKPFVYLEAFERGMLTPDSIVPDVPIRYAGYEPANFDHQFRGPVSVRNALIESLNIPALKTMERIGLDRGWDALRAAGIRSIQREAGYYGISLALGSAEATLLELVEAYAALARLGEYRPLRLCESDPIASARRIASEGAAWLVADILSGAERAMQASGHNAETIGPRYAWKTGTSMGHRDAWTIAYSPRYVVGVWIGNPNGKGAEGLTGMDVAAPLADQLFRVLDPRGATPWYSRPPSVVQREICTVSGMAPGKHCMRQKQGLALAGTTDPTPCTVHRLRPFAKSDGRPLAISAISEPCEWKVAEVWPAEVETWRAEQAQAARASSKTQSVAEALCILSPVRGVAYRFMPGDSSSRQRMELKATALQKGDLFWFVDGECIGSVPSGESAWWPLEPGNHRIACADTAGQSQVLDIFVE